MFVEVFTTIVAAMESLGAHMSRLVRCKSTCCSPVTVYNTCGSIREIYRMKSFRKRVTPEEGSDKSGSSQDLTKISETSPAVCV